MDKLVAAAPRRASSSTYGQADLLQDRPGRDKPALVMRLDMGNPYNAIRAPRDVGACCRTTTTRCCPRCRCDAACVVVNLFMLPDEPDLFRQCVQNIARVRADCDRYGMPLMIEPLVMQAPDRRAAATCVDGDAEKIVTLVRLAREMGADIVKADPTTDPADFHRVVQAARCPVLVRGGGREDLQQVFARSRVLHGPGRGRHGVRTQRVPARQPVGGGGRADGHDPPRRERQGGVGHLRVGRHEEEVSWRKPKQLTRPRTRAIWRR
jgi:class I fructose-bisphosphate aldolase